MSAALVLQNFNTLKLNQPMDRGRCLFCGGNSKFHNKNKNKKHKKIMFSGNGSQATAVTTATTASNQYNVLSYTSDQWG